MENNRILREIANVPDNFGHEIDIETLRLNHKGSLEDYKALYTMVEKENEDLKEERENLSHKMWQLVVLYQNLSDIPNVRYKKNV